MLLCARHLQSPSRLEGVPPNSGALSHHPPPPSLPAVVPSVHDIPIRIAIADGDQPLSTAARGPRTPPLLVRLLTCPHLATSHTLALLSRPLRDSCASLPIPTSPHAPQFRHPPRRPAGAAPAGPQSALHGRPAAAADHARPPQPERRPYVAHLSEPAPASPAVQAARSR